MGFYVSKSLSHSSELLATLTSLERVFHLLGEAIKTCHQRKLQEGTYNCSISLTGERPRLASQSRKEPKTSGS